MTILILSNGQIEDYIYIERHIESYDYIICADGGVRHSSAMGLVPHLIVGDLDSAPTAIIEEYRQRGVEIQSFPTEKDVTDTQIAVDVAIGLGAGKIILAGALGDRWDHSYANVMLLYRIAKRGIEAWAINDRNKITISNSILELDGEVGQLLSLLPFGGDVYIESTSGLKYPIFDKVLYTDYPLGISNVFSDKKVKVVIKGGWVLAIYAKD